MGRSRRGSASVFQRTYRDAKGKNRKTTNWYIEFVAGNRTIREATEFTNRSDAAEFLKKRMSDALGGKIVLSRNVMYDDLRDLIITDYTNNARKSLGDLKSTRLPRLDGVFEGTKAIDITTTSVERYKTLRLKEKAAPATVNRELASLKRMLRLGLRQGMVTMVAKLHVLGAHALDRFFKHLEPRLLGASNPPLVRPHHNPLDQSGNGRMLSPERLSGRR